MPAADRVFELFNDVLGRNPADPAIVSEFVRERVPEGLYLEYKGGPWLKEADVNDQLRRYVSGFANAEGGVLIIGIVGGDVKGRKRWRVDALPRCPDKAGWNAWVVKVLSGVSTRTRVEVQVVPVEAKKVIVIAVNRAEELIRVYEKPRVVCYLRIGDQTFPIDETLYADLATGRRAKPDLTVEQLTVANGGVDVAGFHLNVDLYVHNQGLLWVPDLSLAWSGYAVKGTRASASLKRSLDVRPTRWDGVRQVVGSFNAWDRKIQTWMSRDSQKPVEVRPFELARFATRIDLPLTAEFGPWAWYGTILVLPKNGGPLWAQLAVHGSGVATTMTKGWQLLPGTAPIVAWLEGLEIPQDPKAFFGPSFPS